MRPLAAGHVAFDEQFERLLNCSSHNLSIADAVTAVMTNWDVFVTRVTFSLLY